MLKDNISGTSVIARRFLKNYMRVNSVEPSSMKISRDLLRSVKLPDNVIKLHQIEIWGGGSEIGIAEECEKWRTDESRERVEAINSECTTLELND